MEALRPLEEQRQITAWHDRKLLPGQPWDGVIREELASSDIVLLLVGPDFIASPYCRDVEVRRAVERAETGDAVLIPIIVEPCDWLQESFAAFQSLPLDGSALSESPDVEVALSDCREKLALACVGRWYPRRPRPQDGQHGLWQLTVQARSVPADGWGGFVRRIRQLAGERDIVFHGVHASSLGDGNPEAKRIVLLDGPAPAFARIESAHREGRLSPAVGAEVIRVESVLGATWRASTRPWESGELTREPVVELLRRTPRHVPARLLGIVVRPSDPSWFMPLPQVGDSSLTGEALDRERQRLIGYFFTALAVPGEDMHVNLSVHERSRILPRTLAGAPLGRVLVEQDCLLKQFTASLLHPDTSTGKEYWRRLRAAARRLGLDDRLPLDTCQKTWIVPGNATVTQKEPGQPFCLPLPAGFEVQEEDWAAWVISCRMNVMCETDYVALGQIESRPASNGADGLHTVFLEVFREVLLPEIEAEVNEGSHFAPLRQIYHSLTLAKWYRENLADKGIHTSLEELGDRLWREILGAGDKSRTPEMGADDDAPEWLRDCFARYTRLFREGVFECVRSDEDTSAPGGLRLFFSGGVDLRGLKCFRVQGLPRWNPRWSQGLTIRPPGSLEERAPEAHSCNQYRRSPSSLRNAKAWSSSSAGPIQAYSVDSALSTISPAVVQRK
jgi:hypothetical protein